MPDNAAFEGATKGETEKTSIVGENDFQEINEAKANLDHIYNQPDPRAYFRELRKLDYVIPGLAKPVFQKLIRHLRRRSKDTVRVLDLGCSYGINAALLRYDLSMPALYEHWGDASLFRAAPDRVARSDRDFFGELDEAESIEVIGFDPAEHAVGYAEEVGLLEEGFALNLETDPLPEAARERLAPVDLVISTGCVGYVTEKSFERLLPAVMRGRAPWIANFVLRLFPFDSIEATLRKRGYVTEKLAGRTFVQRRFIDARERDRVLEQMREHGIDTLAEEAQGRLLAEFYLSRPAKEAAEMPLERLLAESPRASGAAAADKHPYTGGMF